MSAVHGLKNGQSVQLFNSLVNTPAEVAGLAEKPAVTVTYHSSPSYGDNNKIVPGATVGHYEVQYPGGRTSRHEHGPHANTERARQRGANPRAKSWAAEQALKEIDTHFRASRNFNDRRG